MTPLDFIGFEEYFTAPFDVEQNTGIGLTESLAMYPAASVCGIYFAHPDAKYFNVGLIGEDQVIEYAERKQMPVQEVERCLNCDIQTVFTTNLCIECDACIDVCPVNCLTITANGEEEDLRTRLSAPSENLEQALYVSEGLPQTGRVMVKDEDLCVHCSLCAERCPTGAWDMQRSDVFIPQVSDEVEAAEPPRRVAGE